MQSTRRSAHVPSPATPQRQSVLRQFILSSLIHSPPTALFFAERLYALDATLEPSVFLLALTLSNSGRHNEVVWLLRQPVSFPPLDPSSKSTDHQNHNNRGRTTFPTTRLPRPSIECSLRCARLYASCCMVLGRQKEGRDVLSKLTQSGSTLITPDAGSEPSSLPSLYHEGDTWILELEMARLSKKAGEVDRAIESYRKVLEANHYCWEALEGLCTLGLPPDPELLFPARPRPVPVAVSPIITHSKPPPPSLPLPLGPSQSSAVNSVVPSKARYGHQGTGKGEGLGFFTPSDSTVALGLPVTKAKAFGQGWTKMMAHNISELHDVSADESLYATRVLPMPAFHLPLPSGIVFDQIAPTHASHPLLSNRSSSSLFTPPVTVAPGVKRTRGGQPPQASTSNLTVPSMIEEDKGARRAVKGVPLNGSVRKSTGSGSSSSVEVRRSTRLSRDALSLSGGAGPASSSSSTTSKSREKQIQVNPRDKKRSKSGTGPSVLSDNGSVEAFSPRSRNSHSSSPAPSSPGASTIHPHYHRDSQPQLLASSLMEAGAQEAEDYVADMLRSFAMAACCAAQYESEKVIEALATLPIEQQRSWRCWIGVAKAHFEMLNYDKAEKAFAQARMNSPHLLESMEMYSTLLWHLRRPTALSFLAQDLNAISPLSTAAWIAAGNVFSHLEDHAGALKCFKRATQLDEECVYAYTLSGHECVVLEEWERALAFFRSAVKRDGRHYNAWFGLGNVYMQTGKYRLAEYHFRKAADINPTNAMLVCCVGSVLEKLGRRKEALILYERACLLAPDSPAVRFKRVRVLISLKQYTLAESDLLNLKNTAPNEYNVNFLLGKLYRLLGKRAEAVKYFTLSQELEPRNGAILREQLEMGMKGSSSEEEGEEHDLSMDVDGQA